MQSSNNLEERYILDEVIDMKDWRKCIKFADKQQKLRLAQ